MHYRSFPFKQCPLTVEIFHQLNESALAELAAIRRACRMASARTLDGLGEYRRGTVYIRYSLHKPPEAGSIEGEMRMLLDRLRNDWTQRDTVWLAGLLLWRLNWIHPYRDGNGRTARAACCMLAAAHSGCAIDRAFERELVADRSIYYAALNCADAAFAEKSTLDAGAEAMTDFMRLHLTPSNQNGISQQNRSCPATEEIKKLPFGEIL